MNRVTTNMFPDTLVSQLSLLSQQQIRLQRQAATGQRVEFPEDDPSAMRRVLDMQAESSSLGQYQLNIARLKEHSTASYDAIRALKTVSDRLGEIAVLADGTKSQDELNIYAAEVAQFIHQAVQVVNSKHGGDYLFSGTLTDQAPFVATRDGNGNVTSVAFQGNTSVREAEIAQGVTLSSQIIGANTTGSGPRGLVTDSRTGADFFAHAISLHNHLLAGDITAIASTDKPQLGVDEDNILFQAATIGAVQSRLEAAGSIASKRSASIEQLISGEANADLTETLVRLTEVQTAYRAALQSGSMILSQSLLDFL